MKKIMLLVVFLFATSTAFAQSLDIAARPLFSRSQLGIGALEFRKDSILTEFITSYRSREVIVSFSHVFTDKREETIKEVVNEVKNSITALKDKPTSVSSSEVEKFIKTSFNVSKLDLAFPIFTSIPIYPLLTGEWVSFSIDTDGNEKKSNINGMGMGIVGDQRYNQIYLEERISYVFVGNLKDIEFSIGLRYVNPQAKYFFGGGFKHKKTWFNIDTVEIRNTSNAPFIEIGFWF